MAAKESLANALNNITILNTKLSLVASECSCLQQRLSDQGHMSFEESQSLR